MSKATKLFTISLKQYNDKNTANISFDRDFADIEADVKRGKDNQFTNYEWFNMAVFETKKLKPSMFKGSRRNVSMLIDAHNKYLEHYAYNAEFTLTWSNDDMMVAASTDGKIMYVTVKETLKGRRIRPQSYINTVRAEGMEYCTKIRSTITNNHTIERVGANFGTKAIVSKTKDIADALNKSAMATEHARQIAQDSKNETEKSIVCVAELMEMYNKLKAEFDAYVNKNERTTSYLLNTVSAQAQEIASLKDELANVQNAHNNVQSELLIETVSDNANVQNAHNNVQNETDETDETDETMGTPIPDIVNNRPVCSDEELAQAMAELEKSGFDELHSARQSVADKQRKENEEHDALLQDMIVPIRNHRESINHWASMPSLREKQQRARFNY
ncbi:hypothetical protein ACJW8F_13140 [Plesiomonas shigelloides]|uniref:hypothetical protein n=1 Tax=Plesiomonas shigelloides TaxID=703 RepID=UPI00387F1AA1